MAGSGNAVLVGIDKTRRACNSAMPSNQESNVTTSAVAQQDHLTRSSNTTYANTCDSDGEITCGRQKHHGRAPNVAFVAPAMLDTDTAAETSLCHRRT